jgi:tRNA nucleotidyltransferase/poly(A) polymerase
MSYKKIMNLLLEKGYEVYFVGGYVRDKLLNIKSFDIDLVTNASVDEMSKLFKNEFNNVDEVGKTFGVLIVEGIEIAQYRSEVYNKLSKPDIQLVKSLIKDSERRDFTVNAIYMDTEGNLKDPQMGEADIEKKLIRAVGNPNDRFKEDPSRILRGLYLSSKLGFTIEENTLLSMQNNKDLLNLVPIELKGKIFKKSIESGTFTEFIRKVMDAGLMGNVISELSHLKDLVQNEKYHYTDAWNHTLDVMKYSETKYKGDTVMVLSSLFHDMCKGTEGIRGLNKEGKPNDIGHELKGSESVQSVLLSFGFGKQVTNEVVFLVKHHGVRIDKSAKTKVIVKWIKKLSKEFKNKEELKLGVEKLLSFVDCDARGFNKELRDTVIETNNKLKVTVEKVLEETLLYVNELSVTGNDALEAGIKGKAIGESLTKLIDMGIVERERSLELLGRWGK